jgi:hypothetical protein
MKLTRILLFGLLLGLPLVLGGCLKLQLPWVGIIPLIYYPQEPRVCPEGIYVGLELPADVRVLGVVYEVDREPSNREPVPILTATSFLMTKPAKAPATPEEAEADVVSWRGFYDVGLQLKDEPVGLNFHCQGSGRTASERATVAAYNWAAFVIVEDPSRASGIEVRRVLP